LHLYQYLYIDSHLLYARRAIWFTEVRVTRPEGDLKMRSAAPAPAVTPRQLRPAHCPGPRETRAFPWRPVPAARKAGARRPAPAVHGGCDMTATEPDTQLKLDYQSGTVVRYRRTEGM